MSRVLRLLGTSRVVPLQFKSTALRCDARRRVSDPNRRYTQCRTTLNSFSSRRNKHVFLLTRVMIQGHELQHQFFQPCTPNPKAVDTKIAENF